MYTYGLPAERSLVSKAAPPVAIMSLSKMQRHLLSAKNGYFKWHYLLKTIVRGFIHFSKRGISLEITTTMSRALRRQPKNFFDT
jgi:hypothetical protein